jgi:DNA/RNA endonuclease YhcR with UshA esterase domain
VYSQTLTVLFALLLCSFAPAECVPFTDAAKHIGSTKCVTGKVAKVTRLASGTTFLNFCEDYRTCPFQVVIFRGDLRHVGDVRQLEGQMVEINGDIKEYDRHAEIILRNASQLKGESAKIPPLPKDFDVEKKGRFSAGKFSHPKSSQKQRKPSRQPAPIQTEDPETQ